MRKYELFLGTMLVAAVTVYVVASAGVPIWHCAFVGAVIGVCGAMLTPHCDKGDRP